MLNRDNIEAIRAYIRNGWKELERSNSGLAVAAVDPKFEPLPDGRWPVYIPTAENATKIEARLRSEMTQEDFERISLEVLPANKQVQHHGLLYLPHPYIVPGGRFNEMYGWDSYFILLGLLHDGEVMAAESMVDNFVYQVEHYGCILNANRTYYLTRSQPPFLVPMVLATYKVTKDKEWLRGIMKVLVLHYTFWVEGEHITPATSLSRYWDFGEGPAPEVVSSELDAEGKTHYDRVQEYFKTHEIADYDVSRFYDQSNDSLTASFYKGDRSMRESGFDPSNRFGPFNTDCVSYNPVCLNSLLHSIEMGMAEIMIKLGEVDEASEWQSKANARGAKIRELMWDEADGLFYDYNVEKQAVRRYPFLTTFYPLWAGIATLEQAERVRQNLHIFERDGGLVTSITQSGCQWDSPYGWAPLELIAVQGLARYGFLEDAQRIAEKFLTLVMEDFLLHNGIVEKYDVIKRKSDVSDDIKFGYSSNEIGFGWTNATVLEFLSFLGM